MSKNVQVVVTAGDINQSAAAGITFGIIFGGIAWAIVSISGWGPWSIGLAILAPLFLYGGYLDCVKYAKAMQKGLDNL